MLIEKEKVFKTQVKLGDASRANAPPMFFPQRNSLVSQQCVHLGWEWGKRYMYVKDNVFILCQVLSNFLMGNFDRWL